MSTTTLMLSVLFGSIGLGYAIYGRKQSSIVPLLCGVALMIFPYFVSNGKIAFAVGAVLAVLPFVFKP